MMTSRRTQLPPLVLLAALAACSDTATEPALRGPSRPTAQIADATTGGNRHFAWLPPTAPAAPAPNGTADGGYRPVVVLCEWTGSACGAALGTFSRLAGTANVRVRVTGAQSYELALPSGRLGMVAGHTYHAAVSLFRTEVGAIDIQAVSSAAQAAAVDRSQFVPVVVGTQLAMAFRLEKGVVYLVEPTGTTVTSLDDPVTLAVPDGALRDEIGATIQARTLPAGAVAGTVLGAYDVGPASTHLALPAQLTIGMGTLPAGVDPSMVAIYQLVGGAWTPVAGSAVDVARNEVGAPISDFGSFAVVATAPAASPTLYDFVSTGTNASCGLKGTVLDCWGFNGDGELGDGTTVDPPQFHPVAVVGAIQWQTVDVDTHPCGLDTAGRAYCWGTNFQAGLGIGFDGGWAVAPTPVGGGLTFRSISVGDWTTCGVTTAGAIYCWGAAGPVTGDVPGQGPSPNHSSPVALGGGTTFSQVSVGHGHACALSTAGAVYCWGRNSNAESGLPWDSYYPYFATATPTQISPPGMTFTSVSAGQIHSCAVTTAGEGYCWGYNADGQLGAGFTDSWSSGYAFGQAAPVVGGHTWETIQAGVGFTCGITTAHEAWCWGNNSLGQIGSGLTGTNVSVPQLVPGLAGVTRVSTGHTMACAIAQNGPEGPGAYCWGYGPKGTVALLYDPTIHRVLGQ